MAVARRDTGGDTAAQRHPDFRQTGKRVRQDIAEARGEVEAGAEGDGVLCGERGEVEIKSRRGFSSPFSRGIGKK